MGLGREPTNSTENTTMVAAIELEVMYCAEKLLGSSNVWGEGRGGEEWAVSHPGNGESRRDLEEQHHHRHQHHLHCKWGP